MHVDTHRENEREREREKVHACVYHRVILKERTTEIPTNSMNTYSVHDRSTDSVARTDTYTDKHR